MKTLIGWRNIFPLLHFPLFNIIRTFFLILKFIFFEERKVFPKYDTPKITACQWFWLLNQMKMRLLTILIFKVKLEESGNLMML